MTARPAAVGHAAGARTSLRRPLATARPGLDYLRSAFVARWDAAGASASGDIAAAYLQAAAGTPDLDADLAAVARWSLRLHQRAPHRTASSC